jgi:hypothetical protein
VVDLHGAAFDAHYAMTYIDGIPEEAPAVEGVTQIWLAPRWSHVMLSFDVRSGWERHEPYDA